MPPNLAVNINYADVRIEINKVQLNITTRRRMWQLELQRYEMACDKQGL
jgi:hypothetical protein